MKQHPTITVNGQAYDTVTGLPVASSKPATPKTTSPHLHATAQRSKTLRRQTPPPKPVRPAAASAPAAAAAVASRKRGPAKQAFDIARHPGVSRHISPTGTATPASQPPKAALTPPPKHPHALKAEQRLAQKRQQSAAPTKVPSSKAIKDAEIAKAIATAKNPSKTPHTKHRKGRRAHRMRLSIIASSVAVVAAIMIWVNLPVISVTIASAQAGVSASFPHFTPDNYTLQLPINAHDNRVTMTFSSAQSQDSFVLSQEKSSWDSQAVRAMVENQSRGQFLTTQDRGLTVYTYNGNAAWVNKGILYKLSGDSRLQNDTIMRIASSL